MIDKIEDFALMVLEKIKLLISMFYYLYGYVSLNMLINNMSLKLTAKMVKLLVNIRFQFQK